MHGKHCVEHCQKANLRCRRVFPLIMVALGIHSLGIRTLGSFHSRAPARRSCFRPVSMSNATASKTEVVEGRSNDMKGKNVIVTGANSGIGLALSKALVSRGAHVTVAARNNAKGAE